MPKIKEMVGPQGLQIPRVVLERSGLREGMSVIIETEEDALWVKPEEVNAAAIRKAALRYLLHHVGDAAEVGAPRRVGSKWQVEVTLPQRRASLGVLWYTSSGTLLLQESTGPEEMIQKAHEA